MKKLLPILILFISLSPAYAQQNNCGNGVPCGPLPWSMPVMPILRSPTPMPTLAVTSSSINPGGATSTPVPIYTPTPLALDMGGISESIATVNAILGQNPGEIEGGIDLSPSSEELINGDFDGSTGWNLVNPSGLNFTDSILSISTAGTSTGVTQSSVFTVGEKYEITVNVVSITGNLNIKVGVVSNTQIINTPGIHKLYFTADNHLFQVYANTAANIAIESVSVLLVNADLIEFSSSAGTFFGYARGLSAESFGPLAPLIVLTLTSFILIVSVKTITFILPVVAALFGIIRKIVSTVLEFLPL